jgi:hypothetical protein
VCPPVTAMADTMKATSRLRDTRVLGPGRNDDDRGER